MQSETPCFIFFERELTRVPRATDRVTLGARSHKHGVWRGSQQPPALLEAFDMIWWGLLLRSSFQSHLNVFFKHKSAKYFSQVKVKSSQNHLIANVLLMFLHGPIINYLGFLD